MVIIFLPKTDEDLTDFPVLINLTESSSLTNYDATNIFKELTPISTKDPYWNNVVLYMPMNGANNGTSFPDYKGKLLLKRSCFLCEETLKASSMDGIKSIYRLLTPKPKNKYAVIYENGLINKGWV